MGFLDIFRRKKKEEVVKEKKVEEQPTDLELICGEDKETYEALRGTMFLDPRKIGISMEEATEKAKDFEKSGNALRAKIWYEVAGGLAIYQGNVERVKQYFGKCQELSPNSSYKILEIPGKAVSKAQEYYKEYLKTEEKK